MSHARAAGQGKKTHEQFLRTVERKDDIANAREMEETAQSDPVGATRLPRHREARESEMPVSRGGMNQESAHNKHNDPGQGGHRPQRHSPADEKQR